MEFLANLVFGLLATIGSLFSSPLDYNLSGQGISQLDQWKSDGTNITQNVANKSIKLSGLTPGGCVQLTAANIATTTGSPCGSGSGGGAFPFTAGTNYGALTNSTSTPVWFKLGLQASSTSRFVDATFTNASSTNLAALSQTTGCATFLSGGALVSTGVACGTGAGGGSFPFTPDSYSGTLVNATSTPIWFKGTTPFSLIATSTFATFASSTVLSNTGSAYFALISGSVGIGTTSPFAQLSINNSTNNINRILFAISSSTATATSTFLTLTNQGDFTIFGTTTNSIFRVVASTSVIANNQVTDGVSITGSSGAAGSTNVTTISATSPNANSSLKVTSIGSGSLLLAGGSLGSVIIQPGGSNALTLDAAAFSFTPVNSNAATTVRYSWGVGGDSALTAGTEALWWVMNPLNTTRTHANGTAISKQRDIIASSTQHAFNAANANNNITDLTNLYVPIPPVGANVMNVLNNAAIRSPTYAFANTASTTNAANLWVDQVSGALNNFAVVATSSATTTMLIDSSSLTQGGCIIMKDAGPVNSYTQIYTLNGAILAKVATNPKQCL